MTQSTEPAELFGVGTWFVVNADGGTVQHSMDDLILGVRSGRVPTHSLVWRQGMRDWRAIDQVPLLRTIAVQPIDEEGNDELTRIMHRAAPQRTSPISSPLREVSSITSLASKAPPKPRPASALSTPVLPRRNPGQVPATAKLSLRPIPQQLSVIVTESTAMSDVKPGAALGASAVQTPVVVAGNPNASSESLGSLLPSVTTLETDMPEWRNPRRPLYLATGAVLAAAAVLFLSLRSAAKFSGRAHGIPTIAAAAPLPESSPGNANAPANPPEFANVPTAVASTTTRQTASINSESDTLARQPAAPRKHGLPLAELERKSTLRAAPSATAKLHGAAAAVVSWDQGPVEHRVWMNPGF